MITRVQWVDVSEYVKAGVRPTFVLPRPKATGSAVRVGMAGRLGEFWVPTLDLLQEDQDWHITKSGENVRVPMHAYRTSRRAQADLVALAFQLGLNAIEGMFHKTGIFPTEADLILGHAIDDLGGTGVNGFRFYMGLALME